MYDGLSLVSAAHWRQVTPIVLSPYDYRRRTFNFSISTDEIPSIDEHHHQSCLHPTKDETLKT